MSGTEGLPVPGGALPAPTAALQLHCELESLENEA